MTIDVQNLTVKNNETAHRFEVLLYNQLGVIEYEKTGLVSTASRLFLALPERGVSYS